MTVIALLAGSRITIDELRRALPGDECISLGSAGALGDAAARVEVLIGRRNTAEILALRKVAPRFRWFASVSAGIDELVEDGVVGLPGLVVTNNRGPNNVPVAEHVIGSMFSVAKCLYRYERARQQARWQRIPGQELRNATLVVYGMGGIGGEVARLAAGIGMRVIGVRRGAGAAPAGVARVVGPAQFLKVAGEADYLAVCVPLTPATRGAISADLLRRLKPTAWLINVARGELVDEAALVDALREGRIGGAALDVFETEPLPPEHPLWTFDNVILTPHSASATPHVARRTLEAFVANLERFKRGEPLANVVDARAGY